MSLVGMKAPEFSLMNEQENLVTLENYKGKYVVLYFYPQDMTPGCTTEACDFRDAYEEFSDLNAVILGVSADDASKHTKFIEKYGLPFTLLVDEDHAVSESYNVWVLKKMYGKEYMGIERSTFLINPDGIVVKEWRKVKVKNHINEVLNSIRQEAK